MTTTYHPIINATGFEVDFGPWEKATMPYHCDICNKGCISMVVARLGKYQFKGCPHCYNSWVTEMEILDEYEFTETWCPADQWNNGESIFEAGFRILRLKFPSFKTRIIWALMRMPLIRKIIEKRNLKRFEKDELR